MFQNREKRNNANETGLKEGKSHRNRNLQCFHYAMHAPLRDARSHSLFSFIYTYHLERRKVHW